MGAFQICLTVGSILLFIHLLHKERLGQLMDVIL